MKDYVTLDHAEDRHKKILMVNWFMGNTCNYACSYCPAFLHDGSTKWPDFVVVKTFILDFVSRHQDKTIYFEFTGGEITMWKHFKELAMLVHDLGCKVSIITNGSRTLRWWSETIKYIDCINVSFHAEFTTLAEFKEKIMFMAPQTRVHVNVIMNPDKFDICAELAEELVVSVDDITIALQPVVDLEKCINLDNYTDEQRAYIDSQENLRVKISHTREVETTRGEMYKIDSAGNKELVSTSQLIVNHENSWVGWKCNAGVEQIIITERGDIYRGWCMVGGTIGNIYSSAKLPTEPIICHKQTCHCNFDITCKKTKN